MSDDLRNIKVDAIIPNSEQPRREWHVDEMEALAEDLRNHGLLNAISVEEIEPGKYMILDGERRWRAVQMIGWAEIPALVRPAMNGQGKEERTVLALVGNLKRKNLNPVEEGYAFKKLRGLGWTLRQIGEMAGYAESNIASRLELVELEPEIQDLFAAGKLVLHNSVIRAVRDMPDEVRIRTARRLAERKATMATILSICRRMSRAAEFEQYGTTGMKYPQRVREPEKEHYNALALVGVEVEAHLAQAVRQTCERCILYDDASPQTCRDCPVVDLVKILQRGKK